ncbi:MAG: nucleotidyl transferase AbiEii/AbiGii toxin family protein [Actinobacteria bacterium]|nr:nucleotidyl transferase AbiEii/AbiGii toxin family protein [Actinomycetota bacterium]
MTPAEGVPYVSARDFERALTDRIANVAASSPHGVAELRRQFAYGRLLARLFIRQPERWVLKGATGLLARLPLRARHSIDVDLYYEGEIDAALAALRDATEADLGDFFTFDVERGASLGRETAGIQVRVTAYLGDKVFETFRVDVVADRTMTAEPDLIPPIEPVEIPGLRNAVYRAHPIPDQIADKHAAMIGTYAGRPSTRYRDLVDLVLIATTQTVSATALHAALVSEHRRRGMTPCLPFSLPSDEWQQGYRKIATTVPGFAVLDATEATEIVSRLVDPVIAGLTRGTWDPDGLKWGSP